MSKPCPSHKPVTCTGGKICLACYAFTASPGVKVGPSYREPSKVAGKAAHDGIETYRRSASERDIVKAIVDGLRYRGRLVLVTGQYRADLAGNTAGLGDLLVWDGDTGHWIMCDVKTHMGPIRPEQQKLVDLGAMHIVRSVEDAFKVCSETLEGLGK